MKTRAIVKRAMTAGQIVEFVQYNREQAKRRLNPRPVLLDMLAGDTKVLAIFEKYWTETGKVETGGKSEDWIVGIREIIAHDQSDNGQKRLTPYLDAYTQKQLVGFLNDALNKNNIVRDRKTGKVIGMLAGAPTPESMRKPPVQEGGEADA